MSGSRPDTDQGREDDSEPGVRPDEERASELPPGADTRGEPDEIDGNSGRGEPWEEAPAEGRLAPDAPDDPPAPPPD